MTKYVGNAGPYPEAKSSKGSKSSQGELKYCPGLTHACVFYMVEGKFLGGLTCSPEGAYADLCLATALWKQLLTGKPGQTVKFKL